MATEIIVSTEKISAGEEKKRKAYERQVILALQKVCNVADAAFKDGFLVGFNTGHIKLTGKQVILDVSVLKIIKNKKVAIAESDIP